MQIVRDSTIKKVNNTVFDISHIQYYNDLFLKYRKEKIIKNDSFSDNVWVLDDSLNNTGYTNTINFENDNTNYSLIIKCLILDKLNSSNRKILPNTLITRYKYLIKVLSIIKDFNPSNLELYTDYLESIKNKTSVVARIQTALLDLLMFTQNGDIKIYLHETSKFYNTEVNYKARNLPNFKSILIFDTKINAIFPELNDYERLKYYILFLWWKITMIIPLRPNEFLKLQYNCCMKDDEGKYWINVPRSKVDDTDAQIKLVYELQCTEEIYREIEKYKTFIYEKMNRKYDLLFPFELRYSTFNHMNKHLSDIYRIDKENQNNNDGNIVLREFEEKYLQNEIQEGQYEHIRLGDTRHYAFCNMILQGLNPLVIAQIGGHTSLKSQMHYYSQIESCTNAYTKELAYRYRVKNHAVISSLNNYNVDEYRSRTLINLLSAKEISNLIEIENGYCIKYKKSDESIQFENCCDSCLKCTNHIIDFEKYPEMKEILINESNEYDKIIKKQLTIIREVSKDIEIDYENNSVDPFRNSELMSTGKQLSQNINKKAIIDSNLLEFILEG